MEVLGDAIASKKISVSVSNKFGLGKSFGFGFVQILGIVSIS